MTDLSPKTVELSPGQVEAKEKVATWINAWKAYKENRLDQKEEPGAPPQLFKLWGFAGTGKTTIIRAVLAEHEIHACFAAFTGKAALVMRRNGLNAGTVHSLIYKPVEPDKDKCKELYAKIREVAEPGEKRRLQAELDLAQKVTFDLKMPEESDLDKADVLVLDECSMIGPEMLADIETFGVPILALGDPGQLPPIQGTGVLITGEPDVFLSEIHRQAADNPIIAYATRARNGVPIPYGEQGTSKHKSQMQMMRGDVLGADQILTGKNLTRRMLNQKIRVLKGFSDPYPQKGEKVICLKNDKGLSIFNGQMGEVVSIGEMLDHNFEMTVLMEGRKDPIKVYPLRAHFDEYHVKDALKQVKWWEQKDSQEFDWGYAITVHKSQGSQWDNVIVWDDKFMSWEREGRKKWLYTAITRAALSVTIAS